MTQKQTIQISKEQAAKLGQIMEWISESGVDSITRDEAAEHCIDLTYNIVKNKGGKIKAKR